MKVYLDPNTLFGGQSGNNNRSQKDMTVKILSKALKEAKKQLAESKNKNPDEKKKDEDKLDKWDYFLVITMIFAITVPTSSWLIIGRIIQLAEVLHK